MKRTILFTFGIGVVFLCMEVGLGRFTVDDRAGFVENPTPGLVREVTAYNVGVRGQTSDKPCIGSTGKNLCRLVTQGLKICAANFVDPETILNIDGYGECVVLDRMHRRYVEVQSRRP